MATIIVYNQDNKLFIITPSPEILDPESATRKFLLKNGIEFQSEEEVINWIIFKDVPENSTYYLTDDSKLPASRAFRNAWNYNEKNDSFEINVQEAIELRKQNLQALKNQTLPLLMNQYVLAIGADNATLKASLETKINDLNNFESLEFPSDLEALENFTPDCFIVDK